MIYAEARVFHLVRRNDVTGVSGVGIVAEGIQWSDGSVAVRWRSEWPSTCSYEAGIDAVLAVHDHNGATVVRWVERDESEETAHLGTAWDRHDDPHWPPPAP